MKKILILTVLLGTVAFGADNRPSIQGGIIIGNPPVHSGTVVVAQVHQAPPVHVVAPPVHGNNMNQRRVVAGPVHGNNMNQGRVVNKNGQMKPKTGMKMKKNRHPGQPGHLGQPVHQGQSNQIKRNAPKNHMQNNQMPKHQTPNNQMPKNQAPNNNKNFIKR